jgi:hypothetical protein
MVHATTISIKELVLGNVQVANMLILLINARVVRKSVMGVVLGLLQANVLNAAT